MSVDRVVLQVPISQGLRLRAEEVAALDGFSSIQEVIRVMLSKFANREIGFAIFSEPQIKLSGKAQTRYKSIVSDFKAGKNIYTAKTPKDLVNSLKK